MLPFINGTEENLGGLLGYCFDSGVEMIMNFGLDVTLRDGDRQYFYWKPPFAPSLMVYFRKRLTPEVLGEINEMIIDKAQSKESEK